MSSSSENFEQARSRSWDILSAAMGGGIALGIGLGVNHAFKGHKLDRSNVGPGTATGASAGSSGTNSTLPSWSYNQTFDSNRAGLNADIPSLGRSRAFKPFIINDPKVANDPLKLAKYSSMSMDPSLAGINSSYYISGNINASQRSVKDKLVGFSWSTSAGGRSSGIVPFMSKEGTEGVQSYFKRKYMNSGQGYTNTIFNDYLGRLNRSKAVVVNAGNRKGVLPSMLLPNKAGGYSHHDPTSIFKRAFTVLNSIDSTNASNATFGRVRAMMTHENLTTNDIGKSITSMFNSLLRTSSYTEDLTQRELSAAYNVIDGIKDHKVALNFFANAGILGDLDAGSPNSINFERLISPGNRKKLGSTGRGYVKFKTVTNPNELFTFTSLEARERLALARAGAYAGLEKEEHQSIGFLSLNRMQDMPNSFGISSGMRVNEFMHARPFSGASIEAASRARSRGFGVWMGETLQNPVRSSMKIAHGKALTRRGLNLGNSTVDLALTTMSAIDFTQGGPLSEGAMFFGRKGAGEFTKATEFVRPSNIAFKIGAGVTQAQITQNISSSTAVVDQIRSQLGLGYATSDSYIAEQFVTGAYNGKVNVKINQGDFFERVINEQEVRFQFNDSFNLTGMNYGAGEVSFQTHTMDNLTRAGTAMSQGGRQHLENMGYIPKDMAKGLSKQTASILKGVDSSVFRPMAVSHASQMKSYDWLNYGVTQYLQTPELLGDTKEAKLRAGKLQKHLSTFGIGAKVNRVENATGGLPGYYVTNAESISRNAKIGTDPIGNVLRALRQEQGSYLERTGVTSGADKYKMFAVMSGQESELAESLVDVNGRKMLLGSNTFESKTASIDVTTGMGKAGMIGGSASQKVNASHWNYARQHQAPHLQQYIEDVMSNSKSGPWLGAIDMSHNANPVDVAGSGGLRGALEHQLGKDKIGGLTELLANGGSSTDEITTVLNSTMLSPKEAQNLPNLSRLYESNKGYVVNIGEGLDNSVAEHFKINMGDASVTKRPLSEVVITPFGHFASSGVDPQYNTFVGGADKAQLEFLRDLQNARSVINSAGTADRLRVTQNQAISISASYMKLTKARDALYVGKTGLVNSSASGVRATLSGYQNILPNDQIIAQLDNFRDTRLPHDKYGTGFYTKEADGTFKTIDKRFLHIGSLESIADNPKDAVRQLAEADITQDVYTFQNNKFVQSGKTGIAMHTPHPALAATVQGVSRQVLLDPTQASKLGLQLPKGVQFTDAVSRFTGYRDTDFDHWSLFFFGSKKNKGVQADLLNIYNTQRDNWEYYDMLRKSLRPEGGLESVKIEDDLRYHDIQTEAEALESINKSTVQKRATGILDKSIETRRDIYNLLLKTPEQYAEHSSAAGVGGGLMQKYFPATEKGLSDITSLMDSIIGSQKQVTISKGFGQNIYFAALNTFDDGLEKSTAGKIQNLTSQALFGMSMSVNKGDMDAMLEEHAKSITGLLSDYATNQLESTEASNMASIMGYGKTEFEGLKAQARDIKWEDTLATIKKSFHPELQSQKGLINDIVSGTLTAPQKKELLGAFGSFHQYINQVGGVRAANTDKMFNFKQLMEMFKTNNFPNGMTPTDVLSAINTAPDITKEGELLRNGMMLNQIYDSVASQNTEAGSIAAKQVENMAANNAKLATTSKAGSFGADLFDIGRQTADYFRWAMDKSSDFTNLTEHVNRTGAIFDSAANFYKKRKGLFAVAGAVAAVGVASHVVGAMSGGDTNIQSAPLPPTTQLDDGATLETPQFNSSPGPPSVRVAREMGSLNSSNASYNGENFGTDVIDELQGFSGVSTFVHDDRSSFNRQSMMSYKDEQSRSRF